MCILRLIVHDEGHVVVQVRLAHGHVNHAVRVHAEPALQWTNLTFGGVVEMRLGFLRD